MKTHYHYLFVSLFVLSAIFIVDFYLAAVIGVVANILGAGKFFFQLVYPTLIAGIGIISVAAPVIFFYRKKSSADKKGRVVDISDKSEYVLDKTA